MTMRTLLLLPSLLCLLTPCEFTRAQESATTKTIVMKTEKEPSPPAVDLSKEAYIWQKTLTRIRLEEDGTDRRETTVSVRVQSEAGVKKMAILQFTYKQMSQVIEIDDVRVIKQDGTVVVTPPYNVQDLPATISQSAPMYSDLHEKHVAVKALGVGDTLQYRVTLKTIKPEAPGHFWLEYSFGDTQIIQDEELDLDLPTGKQIQVNSLTVQPTIATANGRTTYHWVSQNLTKPDPDVPTKSVKHWQPSVQVSSFKSWQQIGDWYKSLQKDAVVVTPAIQSKADQLTKGLSTREEKIQALYSAVALKTHYVGLWFGIGAYQPHSAQDVLENEYGDCKDKHTLLASLLKAEGIEAWPVLVSTKRELDEKNPSPAQFNHVITAIPQQDKILWLDTTTEVAPMGMLSADIRDKQVLAIPSDKPTYIEKTPANPPKPSSFEFTATGTLDEHGKFTGHFREVLQGDVELAARSAFRNTPEAEWKKLLQQVVYNQSFGGEIDAPVIARPEQIEKPFVFEMDYTREKYYQWKDDATSHWIDAPAPPMGGELAPGIKQIKPVDDVELGAIGKNVYDSVLMLPANWSVLLPPSVDLVYDFLEYHSRYSYTEGCFHVVRTLEVKKNIVPLQQWEQYLEFRRGLFRDENHQALISPAINGKKQKH